MSVQISPGAVRAPLWLCTGLQLHRQRHHEAGAVRPENFLRGGLCPACWASAGAMLRPNAAPLWMNLRLSMKVTPR